MFLLELYLEQFRLIPSPSKAIVDFARTWQRSIDIILSFQRLTISLNLPLRSAFSSTRPPSWPEELNLTHLPGLPLSFDIVYLLQTSAFSIFHFPP